MASAPAPGYYPPEGVTLTSVQINLYCTFDGTSTAFTKLELVSTYTDSSDPTKQSVLTQSGIGLQFPEAILQSGGVHVPLTLMIVGTLAVHGSSSIKLIQLATGTLSFTNTGTNTNLSPFFTGLSSYTLSGSVQVSNLSQGAVVQIPLTVSSNGQNYSELECPGSWQWAGSQIQIIAYTKATVDPNATKFNQTFSIDPEMELSESGSAN